MSRGRWMPPFTQTDPNAAEAEATGRLEDFLEARVAGEGAEGPCGPDDICDRRVPSSTPRPRVPPTSDTRSSV